MLWLLLGLVTYVLALMKVELSTFGGSNWELWEQLGAVGAAGSQSPEFPDLK